MEGAAIEGQGVGHGLHHAQARECQPFQRLAPLAQVQGAGLARSLGMRRKAQGCQPCQKAAQPHSGWIETQQQTAIGGVDLNAINPRLVAQSAFDQPSAGRAVEIFHQQFGFPMAIGKGGNKALLSLRPIVSEEQRVIRRLIRRSRRLGPPAVISAKPRRLDPLGGHFTACAADRLQLPLDDHLARRIGGQGLAAMEAPCGHGLSLPRDQGKESNFRCVGLPTAFQNPARRAFQAQQTHFVQCIGWSSFVFSRRHGAQHGDLIALRQGGVQPAQGQGCGRHVPVHMKMQQPSLGMNRE